MRTRFLMANVLLMSCVCTVASAKQGFYLSANAGYNFKSKIDDYEHNKKVRTDNFKNSVNYGFGLGYDISNISVDLTYTRFNADKKQTVAFQARDYIKSNLVLLNGYYNFNNIHDVLKPYIGIGVGVVSSKTFFEDLNNAFAYQGVVGCKFKLSEHIKLFSDLRYTAFTKAGYKSEIEKITKTSVYFYSANVGFMYNF